ncbi:RNA-directed DNA polymerase [Thalassotalea sp. PP2-459]|uniref:RNA-directed DNA polymerase n=1 Tax=Thalassotalea sp. PP2-459 TaxID=1742724 RepID=UPI00094520D8|nr:RNA-directed DNA polymerase [Thalassotalea sp. PP2-459]OKY27127.1 hypothetical protein BI291_18015 [Thalassotalea sp. PP2-459]
MNRTKLLLKLGYLPIQLPPAFNSRSFADKYQLFEGAWNAQRAPKSRAEKYSVARSSFYRRTTSILNPIGYYKIAKEIDTHWLKIERHYRKSSISLSKPRIAEGLRAIEISKFHELYEAKVEKSSGYKFALITDLVSYFPSIYTHSIPWAIHTKALAKIHTEHSEEYYGNLLDAKSMSLQDGQTMGIPIGPDTSHIISELIGTSIDRELYESLGYWPAGFRYVDDYYLFFNSREESERALATLTKIAGNFELQVSPAKTKIIEVKELVEESWKYSIKQLRVSSSRKAQRDDIHNYFQKVFSLEKQFKDESIIKYSLRQISSSIIKKTNWSIFESYLFKCGYGFPNTLQTIVTIFSTYKKFNYPLNQKALHRFCENLITEHSISDHHGEVSWLLWLVKELNIPLKREIIREVESMSSNVCKLMIIDLYESGITRHNLKAATLRQYARTNNLLTEDWLIAYEAGKRLWLKNDDDSFIRDNHFFKKLLMHSVSFYDETARCASIFNVRESLTLDDDWFDNDEDVHEHFEFDEQDEEYFDSLDDDDDDLGDW